METHSVQLGSVMLHGYAEMPDPFAGLAVTAVNGWRGLPGARGDNDPIPGAHGSYGSTRVLRELRSIEVRGAAIAATEFEALALVDQLEAAVAGAPVEMWVNDAQGAYSRVVEVEAVQIVGAYNRNRVVFAVDLTAADPRRYRAPLAAGPAGLPTLDGGLTFPEAFPWNFGDYDFPTASVVNDGDIPVLPVVTITGAADSIVVHGGAQRIEFGDFAGVLVFDSVNRRAWLNGTDVTREMIRRDWPVVAAGETDEFYFVADNPDSTTQLVVDYKIGAW